MVLLYDSQTRTASASVTTLSRPKVPWIDAVEDSLLKNHMCRHPIGDNSILMCIFELKLRSWCLLYKWLKKSRNEKDEISADAWLSGSPVVM